MDAWAGQLIKVAAILGLAFPMTFACRPETGGRRAARVDGLLAGLVSGGEPGASVLVADEGGVVFEKGFGVMELRTSRPIDGRTNFRLASLTKQFTAAAVMLCVRDGTLRYEDRLTDIFPDFPEYGRAITVRHLLEHTSGLPDYEDLMPAVDPSAPVENVQITDAGVLDLLKAERRGKFAPGSRWSYSNSGYVVLGLIAGKASGVPFADFLRERIFVPLKMTGTLAYVHGKNAVANRAFGHSRTGGGWKETDQSPTSATLGDGGVYSSISDLRLWDEAIRRRGLLSEAETRLALTPARVPGGTPSGPDGMPAEYGFGWFLNQWKGRARAWHYGETEGFRTAIQRLTDDGLTVVVLCNRADLDASAISLKIADLFLCPPRPRGGSSP